MTRTEKENLIFRELIKIAKKEGIEHIDMHTIKEILQGYGVRNRQLNSQIDYTIYFPYIMDKIQKKNGIKTIYDSDNAKLRINSTNKEKDNHFKIKLYLSISPKEMIPTIEALCNFISDNNIEQTTKIESRDRSDTIKIKLYKKDDARKLINFINTNEIIKSVCRKPNPFLSTEGIVGISIENRISYNSTLSYLMSKYVETKSSNQKNEITTSDFKEFIDRFFYNTFISRVTLDNFAKDKYIKENIERIQSEYPNETNVTENVIIDFMHSINTIRVSLLDNNDDLNNMLSVFDMANDKEFNKPQIKLISEIIDLDYSETALKQKEEALANFIKHSYNNGNSEEEVVKAVKKYYDSLPDATTKSKMNKARYESPIDKKSIKMITDNNLESYIIETIKNIEEEKRKQR